MYDGPPWYVVVGFLVALVVAISAFGVWDEALEVAGLNSTQVKTAADSQCEQMRDVVDSSEVTVRCTDTDREYIREVRETCRDEPDQVDDRFLFGNPDTGEVTAPPCPRA